MAGRQVDDEPLDLSFPQSVSLAAMTSRCQFVANVVCGLSSEKQR